MHCGQSVGKHRQEVLQLYEAELGNTNGIVGFDVLTAVVMKSNIFWDI
jgi:hypothetical protein